MRGKRLRLVPGGLVVLLLSAALAAQPTASRSYAVPQRGLLALAVPAPWRDSVWQRTPDAPPTVTFTPDGGAPFQVLVTPIAPARPDIKAPTSEELKAGVERVAQAAAAQAVEKTVAVRELKGPAVLGYYFAVTDPAPPPGEFKFMTQGMMGLGDVRVTFTILTNDGQADVVAQALAMLASATLRGEARAAPASQGIVITGGEASYAITVPVSRLALTLPRGRLVAKQQASGGATDNPRYFYFEDPAAHLVVSGWFEPAARFSGMDAFWQAETSGWKRNGLPEAKDVAFETLGRWQAVSYETALPRVTNSHLRAHWVEAGTWIDLHLSLTSARSAAESRALLKATLAGIAVTVKPQ